MRCESCGTDTRINYGNADRLLCEKCQDSSAATGRSISSATTLNQNDYQRRSDYNTARFVSNCISYVGWAFVLIGLIVTLLFFANADVDQIASAIGAIVSGLLLVAAGHVSKATLDNADNTREILALMRAKGDS